MTDPSAGSGPVGSRTLALGGLLVGAALSFLAGTQPWWRARGEGLDVAFSGASATGGVSQALALAAGAGGILMLTLASRGRRLVAVILVVVGLGMAALAALRMRPDAEAVQDQVRTVSLIDQFSLSATLWPAIYVAAGIMITMAAVITVVRSGRWPRRPDRFSRRTGSPARALSEAPAEAWSAMDAGLDPTADSPPASAQRPDPDVQLRPQRDTMGGTKHSAQSQRSAE
jgi:hypothetical protein